MYTCLFSQNIYFFRHYNMMGQKLDNFLTLVWKFAIRPVTRVYDDRKAFHNRFSSLCDVVSCFECLQLQYCVRSLLCLTANFVYHFSRDQHTKTWIFKVAVWLSRTQDVCEMYLPPRGESLAVERGLTNVHKGVGALSNSNSWEVADYRSCPLTLPPSLLLLGCWHVRLA